MSDPLFDFAARLAREQWPTPLGHNSCNGCGSLSLLYHPWPSCRDCLGATCPRCMAKGSEHTEEFDAPDGTMERVTVICRACAIPYLENCS